MWESICSALGYGVVTTGLFFVEDKGSWRVLLALELRGQAPFHIYLTTPQARELAGELLTLAGKAEWGPQYDA